jgi:hypothetical protein
MAKPSAGSGGDANQSIVMPETSVAGSLDWISTRAQAATR